MENQVTSAPPAGVGAEVRHEKVIGVDTQDKIITTEANQYQAKAIILAVGSTMQRLGVPGEEKFIGKGISYYAKRDFKDFAGKRVLVVGGGNTTAKSALVAKSQTSETTLVHRRESLRAYPRMVKRLQKEGVDILYNTEVKEIKGNDKVESAVLVNNKTGEQRDIAVDWIVICVGTEPNDDFAKQVGVDMAGRYIKVDDRMMTNKAGVFACGEITGGQRHLINAAAEGASAGMATSEYLALEKVKKGDMFQGAVNGKYADEYLTMLG
jgi:thioredoxin reductase (NADPH)